MRALTHAKNVVRRLAFGSVDLALRGFRWLISTPVED